MVEINLLPWRTEKSRYQRKLIYILCACGASLSLVLMLAVHGVIEFELSRQKVRVNQLREQFPIAKTPKISLQTDDARGARLASIFKRIGETVHAGMCYQRITRDESGVHLSGSARSAQAMMAAWRYLSQFHEFSSVRIKEFKSESSGSRYQFVLELPLHIEREEW